MVLVLLVTAFVVKAIVDPTSRSAARSGASAVGRPSHSSGSKVVSGPYGLTGRWKLILNTSFSGRSLDTSIWRPDWFGSGISGPINSHELACYSSANVTLPGDSTVHLNVTHTPSYCQGSSRPYTGGVLSTNPYDGRSSGGFQYRYGVLQAKVFVPGAGRQVANWPAVIALGQVWPKDGEDDVMENLSGTICSHFHSPGYAPGGPLGACDPGFTPGWHIISSNWEPGNVTWYYDGIEIAHIREGVTSAPMYIALVNSVSSKAPQLAMPAAMRVSYVRVWQKAKRAGS